MKIDKLDKLFSEYIRKRAIKEAGGCERCLNPKYDIEKENGIFPAWKQLQCSHFKGRARKSVRYDEDNAAGLCGGCHMYLTAHPDEHEAWFKERLGEEKFDLLICRSSRPQKVDKDLIYLYFKQKIEDYSPMKGEK